MFGYEALDKGAVFYFEVEVDSDDLAETISAALLGERNIGRSRTAQYGLVKIEKYDFTEAQSRSPKADGYVTVYADGRLIFIDDNGEPTFRPTAKDLGLDSGEIDWERSQVRTFQYAPWNGKRKTRDADRCGIEKGSVFVVKDCKDQNFESKYVGVYRNEGFGRVIYNPEFLDTADGAFNGQAKFKLNDGEKEATKTKKPTLISADKINNSPLLKYINRAISAKKADEYIREKVNKFVDDNAGRFSGECFASQWGTIRTIAMQYKKSKEIKDKLFAQCDDKKKCGYLTHGVAKEQWDKRDRRTLLQKFVEDVEKEAYKKNYGDITAKALINLASEMAKICKKQEQ